MKRLFYNIIFITWMLIICHQVSIVFAIEDLLDLEPSTFLVSGPGLNPKATFPVRYILVQLVDRYNNLIHHSKGNHIIHLDIHSADNTRTPINSWHDVVDLQDGSYAVRYKIIQSLSEQDIQLRLSLSDGRPIAASPYYLAAPIYSEFCDCPQGDLQHFLDNIYQCPSSYPQIDNDFAYFPKHVNPAETAKQFAEHYAKGNEFSMSACRYVVTANNSIYRRCFGEHIGFNMFSDHAIISMARKTRLPRLDFIMNLGDWPLSSKRTSPVKLPIVSWCGNSDTTDIVIPTYETMEWVLDMMTRVSLDIFTALAAPQLRYMQKKDILYWRGRDSSDERLKLVRYSVKHPDQVDARLTNMFFFDNDTSLGESSPNIPFLHFYKYRYLAHLDGTVAAYRLGLLMAGNSTILKQDSSYYEYFYSDLKPYIHYVPLRNDISDLMVKLKWCRDNPVVVQQIAMNAREFVRKHLMPVNVLCYYGRVLQRLSRMTATSETRENKEDISEDSLLKEGFQRITEWENGDPTQKCKCVESIKSEPGDDQLNKRNEL